MFWTGSYLRLSDRLMYNTVKINSRSTDGIQTVGTGFIFKFFRTAEDSVPVFVSKHVIESSLDGEILMHLSNTNNNVIHDNILVPLDRFTDRWIPHPHPDVDLAIMPIGPVVNDLLKRGIRPFYTAIDSTTIPRDSEWKRFTPIEDILLVYGILLIIFHFLKKDQQLLMPVLNIKTSRNL